MDDMKDSPLNNVNVSAAQEAIEKDRHQRVQDCGKELQALLEKYGCALSSYQELINGMPKCPAQIMIVATR